MSLYYLTPYQRKTLRRRMWDQNLDAKLAGESCQVIIPVDVIAYDEGYTISAFIPGANHEDINIEVVDDTVTIEGEIKLERSQEDQYILAERPSGKFRRVISLPNDVNADGTEAELKNGVLTVRVPKSELAKPRKIKISNN